MEIRGLQEGVILTNPSEMEKATLDAIIDKSGSIYFVHISDVNDNHVGDGNSEGGGRSGGVGEGSGVGRSVVLGKERKLKRGRGKREME